MYVFYKKEKNKKGKRPVICQTGFQVISNKNSLALAIIWNFSTASALVKDREAFHLSGWYVLDRILNCVIISLRVALHGSER